MKNILFSKWFLSLLLAPITIFYGIYMLIGFYFGGRNILTGSAHFSGSSAYISFSSFIFFVGIFGIIGLAGMWTHLFYKNTIALGHFKYPKLLISSLITGSISAIFGGLFLFFVFFYNFPKHGSFEIFPIVIVFTPFICTIIGLYLCTRIYKSHNLSFLNFRKKSTLGS